MVVGPYTAAPGSITQLIDVTYAVAPDTGSILGVTNLTAAEPGFWSHGLMQTGAVLFINELNRMPEGVQNVLLPALDEGMVHVPHLGTIQAIVGFQVIATQNPAEFVATGHLSEALLDRFELVPLGYQTAEEEETIVQQETQRNPSAELVAQAVTIARATRSDPRIRRGASVRAAVAIADLAAALDGDVSLAARLALPTRIELTDAGDHPFSEILGDLQKKSPSRAPLTR